MIKTLPLLPLPKKLAQSEAIPFCFANNVLAPPIRNPAYKNLPFCTGPQSISLPATEDVAGFMDCLIKPIRS